MLTGLMNHDDVEIRYSFLNDQTGKWMQLHYSIVPTKIEHLSKQLAKVKKAEELLFNSFAIEQKSLAAKRIFSSDLINHREALTDYKSRHETDFYYSLTEQPPASSTKLALLAMCLNNITEKFRNENLFYFDTTSGIRHIFAERLVEPDESADSERQTERVFSQLKRKLAPFGASIDGSVLRTWLYAPHLDADYSGIVRGRKTLFDMINLTEDTHYIASTGIQGGSGDPFARVSMDAYAVTGMNEHSVRYIQAPEYLSPTHTYGVTFERATAVKLGKTDFLFISGTASIDAKGDVVHLGDVVKQTDRTLTNIVALLDSAGFTKEDLSSFIVYLRDATDYCFVRPLLDNFVNNLPIVYVKAPVCRPEWLIEIEATASKVLA